MGSYVEEVLRDRPFVYWPGYSNVGGPLLRDWSGNGLDGTLAATSAVTRDTNTATNYHAGSPVPTYPPSPYLTTNTTGAINVQSPALVNLDHLGTTGITFECFWYLTNEWSDAYTAIGLHNGTYDWHIANRNYSSPNYGIRVSYYINSGDVNEWLISSTTVPNGWHHLVGVIHPTFGGLYIDGVFQSAYGYLLPGGGWGALAFAYSSTGFVSPFGAAHVAMYPYGLTANQVARHYAARGNRTTRFSNVGRRTLTPAQARAAGVWAPFTYGPGGVATVAATPRLTRVMVNQAVNRSNTY